MPGTARCQAIQYRNVDQDSAPTEPRPAASTDATLALMKEMHDTLLRIEQRLGEQDR